MTGEVVSLNRARKATRRAMAGAEAAANRAAFGRTKAEKKATTTARERLARALDGARREDAPS